MKRTLSMLIAGAIALTSIVTVTGCSGISDDTVIAHLADGVEVENPEDYNVTYGQFRKEYQLYLDKNGYDDTSEEYADTCEEQRQNIVDYLIEERIFLNDAEEKGLGVDALTEEELESIDSSTEETLNAWYDSFKEDVTAEIGDSPSDKELLEKEKEAFNEFLKSSGVTEDDFYIWQRNSVIEQKLMEYVYKDAEVTDDNLEKTLQSYLDTAENLCKTDVASYQQNSSYTAIYVPEGSKVIQQILISFDSETISEIKQLRTDGDNDDADDYRDENLVKIKDKAEAALEKLENGEDFKSVMKECSDESADEDGNYPEYTVIPNDTLYVSEFTDAAKTLENIGDHSGITYSDYGYHILYYADDAKVTDEDIADFKVQLKDYLLQIMQYSMANDYIESTKEKFPYEIEYELINLSPDDATAGDSDKKDES